jgi:hypothetical protein
MPSPNKQHCYRHRGTKPASFAPPQQAVRLYPTQATQLEQEFTNCMQIEENIALPKQKAPSRDLPNKEEQWGTPERKVGVWSQQLNDCSTAKREDSPSSTKQESYFKTPPKRTTKPTMEELERWDRMERETNRRGPF